MGIFTVLLILHIFSGYISRSCDLKTRSLHESLNVTKLFVDVIVIRFRGTGQISIRHSSEIKSNLITLDAKWKFPIQYQASSNYLRIIDKSIHHYGRSHLQIEVGYYLKNWNWSIDAVTISFLIVLLVIIVSCVSWRLGTKFKGNINCLKLSSKVLTGKNKETRAKKKTYRPAQSARNKSAQPVVFNEEIVEMMNLNNFSDPEEVIANPTNHVYQFEKPNSEDEESLFNNSDIMDTNSVKELIYKLHLTQRQQFYRVMRTVFILFCSALLISIFLLVTYLSLNEDKTIDYRCYIQSLELTIPQSFETSIIEIYHSSLKDLQRDHDDNEFYTNENNFKIHNYLLPYLKQIPINIFDIDDAAALGYPICDANEICQTAWRQGRLGCDPVSQKCVCTRGFHLYNGACIDINECLNENMALKCTQKNKVCLNTIGSFKCVCNNAQSDANLCETCNLCPENQFDYHQCMDKKNAFCIDIINPLLTNSKYSLKQEDRKNFKLITSENVFSEDLLRLEPINSSILITTNYQNFSVNMFRKSGLVLQVNLHNISINPVYEDVTHSGDNSIILKSSKGSSTYHLKNSLMDVLKNHCRFPIPKYYYITMNEYRHRYTTAVKIICANQKYPNSKVFCPDDHFDGQIYYFRTVNDRCSTNNARKLPFERNSFYCTQNTDFVKEIFNYQVDEKIFTSQKSICDTYHKKCKTCLRNSMKSCQSLSRKSKSCCETKCYSNLSCMAFYTSKCYDSQNDNNAQVDNICIKGDTLKFTLFPKFDFENESFLCHIKRNADSKPNIQLSLNLQIIQNSKLAWSSNVIFKNLNLEKFYGQKLIDFLSIEWRNNIEIENEMYLKGFRERGNKFLSYKLYKMKKRKDFYKIPMKIYKHQDSKYLQFQNAVPFYFNSENWFNFSCRLNKEDFYPIQDVYKSNYQNVKLIKNDHRSREDSKSSFKYTIDSLNNPAQVHLHLLNKSIIPSFLCNERSGKLILLDSNVEHKFLQLISLQWPKVWSIYFEGSVSDIPTYINIRIIDISSQSVLFLQDQIIHKSYYDTTKLSPSEYFGKKSFQFTNNFHFEKKYFSSYDSKNFGFQFEITDCFKKYVFKLYHFSKITFPNSHIGKNPDFNQSSDMTFMNIANKITTITLFVSSIYFLLILFYILLSLWRKMKMKQNYWENVKPKMKRRKSTYTSISCRRKIFMLFYVAFRVFYTFLFTLSVSLSLLLGIDSYSNELYGNQQKILSWINQESKQINQISITELKRQLQYSTNLRKVCENQDYLKIGKLDKEILLSLNSSIHRWYDLNEKSILNQSIEFSKINIINYENRIDKIAKKLQFNIRNRFLDRYGQYQQLIKQYYYLLYFKIIQKIHNDSQLYVSQTGLENTNNTFVQSSLMEFFNFLEIFEPKSLNFYPIQNLKKLGKQFTEFESNPNNWRNQFKGKPFKYRPREKLKSYFRMFDTKYFSHHLNTLVFESAEKPNNPRKINIKSLTTFKILKTRIVLMVIDCFIVIYRFYNTFEILKWIFLGRKIYLFNSMPKEVDKKKCTENVNIIPNDMKFSQQLNYGFAPITELSLRIISQNRFPDWSLINSNPNSYSSCFKSRKYFQSFGQMHFISVTIVFLVLVALLTFVVVTNYWYIKNCSPEVHKQNLEVLQKSQWLINFISKKISDYINNYSLANSKIHNMNMSSLIINSSYLLSHNQKIVCQQLNWEIKSIRSRSNTHSTLSSNICPLQSDVNFLPQLLMHISPCQFLSVLPINYTTSAMFFDKSTHSSNSINKINQFIFLIILLSIIVATFIGSVQIVGNVILKSVLGTTDNNRHFFLSSTYPHANSVKIHSSSSHSNQSARNLPVTDSNCRLKRPLPTVTSGQFNDFSASLHFFQLTATSESDV